MKNNKNTEPKGVTMLSQDFYKRLKDFFEEIAKDKLE
jgi:hypothetical protein